MVIRRKKNEIHRYTSITNLIDMLRRKQIAILNPQRWDDRNDKFFMELYMGHRKAEGLYALCAAMRRETYHHWRVFTGGDSGACVVLKRALVEQHLTSVSKKPAAPLTSVRFGEVKYLKLSEVEEIGPAEIDQLPFLKRYGFTDEAEFRIVIETNTTQQEAIYIDFQPEWIDRIYINPWLPKQQADSLIETLKSIDGSLNIKITRSRLIDSDTWRAAGNRVSNREVTPKIKIKMRPDKV
jgi:hypothetical protein